MPEETLAEKKSKMRLLWAQACTYDGIPPKSPFVVFSDDNPYLAAYQEAYSAVQEVAGKEYTCWTSHSCYVCSDGTGVPKYHVSSRGYEPTSPCDSITTLILADTRAAALREYKEKLQKQD